MQLLSKLLVRVSLNAQSLVDGQDLEEEGEFVTKFFGDGLGEKGLVVGEEVEEGSAGGDIARGVRGVSAHPELLGIVSKCGRELS